MANNPEYIDQESVWAAENNTEHYWEAHSQRSKWFAERIPPDVKSIFEVGCSSGRNLRYILEKRPDLKVGGIDINKQAISFAKDQIPNGEFVVGSIYDNSWVEGCYDMVFTSGVMLHIVPDKIDEIINKIITKSKMYISHMETNGANKIINWEAHKNPLDKVSRKLYWEPNILDIYSRKGLRASIQNIPCGETGARHHIYIDLTNKKEHTYYNHDTNMGKINSWLDKVAYRCSASNAGPWIVRHNDKECFDIFIDNGKLDKKICTVYNKENADFIANSANDVRLLVHSVRTLIDCAGPK